MSVSKGAFPWGERGDRMLHDERQDCYKMRKKLHEPTVCPQCSAVYHEGRWKWMDRPEGAKEEQCPACHRIADRYEAGIVTITGDFLKKHREELISLARHEERNENEEHPLHRIMDIQEEEDSIVITTTDIHLPRRIGQALHHSWHGDLTLDYDEEGYFIRVNWSR